MFNCLAPTPAIWEKEMTIGLGGGKEKKSGRAINYALIFHEQEGYKLETTYCV